MKKLLIAALVTALFLTGVAAFASIPSPDGTIHACYQNPPPSGGANLAVIDKQAGGTCSGGKVEIAWNQAGPTGPAGPQGATGPAEPAGPVGTSISDRIRATGTASAEGQEFPLLASPYQFTQQADQLLVIYVRVEFSHPQSNGPAQARVTFDGVTAASFSVNVPNPPGSVSAVSSFFIMDESTAVQHTIAVFATGNTNLVVDAAIDVVKIN